MWQLLLLQQQLLLQGNDTTQITKVIDIINYYYCYLCFFCHYYYVGCSLLFTRSLPTFLTVVIIELKHMAAIGSMGNYQEVLAKKETLRDVTEDLDDGDGSAAKKRPALFGNPFKLEKVGLSIFLSLPTHSLPLFFVLA